ncbi:MAG: hypothetical protein MUC97_19115 [Bernardetiaceae bacterium]|jgi:hypothetical protein|nr:hypothetical protein [Bernardetiaceae bacterium]
MASPPQRFLLAETRSLLTRLEQIQPFALTMPMVHAATVADAAMRGITDRIRAGKRELRLRARRFMAQLRHPSAAQITPAQAQMRFSLLKLRFNALLDQLDIFADVLLQRAEHPTGVWVAGLDILAQDSLLAARPYLPKGEALPPLMCFLERGHGAAIRRARTRLPGGDLNPVAVIQVPRERMVGSGIGSSLVHEVGHQGAALLGLVNSLRADLAQAAQQDPARAREWKLLASWISEIVADFWATGHLGIAATTGLINVVSLPHYFVFRFQPGAVHPFPWIRVQISLAVGRLLFPDPQWVALQRQWEQLYPLSLAPADARPLIGRLMQLLPDFVRRMANHRPRALGGATLASIFPLAGRQPGQLRQLFQSWLQQPGSETTAPTLVFAALGQARHDGKLRPNDEFKWLSRWLIRWAQARAESRGETPAGAARPTHPSRASSPKPQLGYHKSLTY